MRAHVHLERAHLAIAEDRPSVAAQELDKGEETCKKLGARSHLDQVSALRLRSRRPATVEDGSPLGSKLATIEDMDTLLRAVLDEMRDVTAAERGRARPRAGSTAANCCSSSMTRSTEPGPWARR